MSVKIKAHINSRDGSLSIFAKTSFVLQEDTGALYAQGRLADRLFIREDGMLGIKPRKNVRKKQL